MCDAAYNPNDPEFLASCARDGELADAARRRLDAHLIECPALRAFVSDLASVDRLVGHWAETDLELDWAAHAALVDVRIEGDVDEALPSKVDDLLAHWATHTQEIDEDRFVGEITRRVTSARGGRRTRRLIFRIGAPLASAAAVALVATAWLGDRAVPQPFVQVLYRIPAKQWAHDASPTDTYVRFDRSPPEGAVGEARAAVVMIAMGSSPLSGPPQEDFPPP